MQMNFHSILNDHGFTPNSYDFESTIIGWSYDLIGSLLQTDTIFDLERSQIIRQWDNPEAYIYAILVPVDGDIAGATHFLLDRWYSELRYDNPVFQVLNIQSSGTESVINILTITKSNAMTLKFTIRKENDEPIQA